MPQTLLTAVSRHLQDGRFSHGRDGRRVSAPEVGVAWQLPANGRSGLSAANERAARAEPLEPWPRAVFATCQPPGPGSPPRIRGLGSAGERGPSCWVGGRGPQDSFPPNLLLPILVPLHRDPGALIPPRSPEPPILAALCPLCPTCGHEGQLQKGET